MVKFDLREEWTKLKTDLAPMPWSKRLDHLWTYYKEYLVVVVMIVATIIMLVSGAINKSKEILLAGVLCNVSMSQEGYEYLTDDYFQQIGGIEGKQLVSLDSLIFEYTGDYEEVNKNFEAAMTGAAMVSGQLVDYFLMDEYSMMYYLNQGMFLELETFLTEEELAQFGEDLVYLREETEEEKYAYALNVTELDFVKDCIRNEGQVYLAIAGNAPNLDAARDTWQRILDWEKEE